MIVSLNPIYNADPCPRVEVTVTAIPAGSRITVLRSWAGSEEVVRDARRVAASGSGLWRDFEPPFGVDVTYRVTAVNSLGAVVDVASATTVIADGEPAMYERVWIQNPLNPRSATEVVLTDEAVQSISYRRDGVATHSPLGGGLPLMMGGSLTGQKVPLSFYTVGVEHNDAVRDLLNGSVTQLLRTRDPVSMPRAAYIGMQGIELITDDFDRDVGARVFTWAGEASIVRAPVADIAVPAFMYSDVEPLYAGLTYAQVEALRPGSTYLDWERDPRP